jgi:hypothetical protein
MAAAARRAGRDPGTITLIGISKTMPIARIQAAFAAGLDQLGENRVQEAREKIAALPDRIRWHLVGHLQKNKAKQAAGLFQVVHSIDSIELLGRLERAAAQEERSIEGLIQVDLAGEATKSGVPEEGLDAILEEARSCRQVVVRGLMILPPYDADPERSRPYFRRLRTLMEEARPRHPMLDLRELSMGMTEDFEVAIEEGATMVRVGRAIFGERPRPGGDGHEDHADRHK